MRRNLQREHLARVANALVRPSSTMPADARALLRQDARALRDELKAVPAKTDPVEGNAGAHRGEPDDARRGAQGPPAAAGRVAATS